MKEIFNPITYILSGALSFIWGFIYSIIEQPTRLSEFNGLGLSMVILFLLSLLGLLITLLVLPLIKKLLNK